ncbi:hypothetical protein GF357_03540 [Candidatus Dojkabacteria bacterium]|nr:hypothetical protein [Candidatus Dojkabacteria bacterium]
MRTKKKSITKKEKNGKAGKYLAGDVMKNAIKSVRIFRGKVLAYANKHPRRVTAVLLAVLAVLAVVLRLRGIGTNLPNYDEIYHLTTAKAFCAGNGGKLFINAQMHGPYHRAMFITKLVQIFWLLGGTQSLFLARLPSVIIGGLTVILIYLLGSRIDKKTGFLAALMWALAPWSIITSRLVREYSFFNFIWTGVIFTLYWLLTRIAVSIENKEKINPWLIAGAVGLVVLPILYDSLTHMGTFKLIIPMYFVVFLAFGFQIKPFIKKVRMRTIVIVGAIAILIAFIINKSFLSNKSWAIDFVNIFPSYSGITQAFWRFITGTQHANFFRLGILLLVAGMTALGYYYKTRKLNSAILIGGVFAVLSYFFAFHFNRFIRARYLYVLLPWMIIIESFGLIQVVRLFGSLFKITPKLQKSMIAVLFLILFNWPALHNSLRVPFDPEYFRPETSEFAWMSTFEYAQEAKGIYERFGDEIEGEVVFTTMTYPFFWYVDDYDGDTLVYNIDPLFDSAPEKMPIPISNYFPVRLDEDVLEVESLGPNSMAENSVVVNQVIAENDSGWFLVGLKPNSWWDMDFAPRDFTAGDKVVEYVGTFEGHLVFKW